MKVIEARKSDVWDDSIYSMEGSPFHCKGFLEPISNGELKPLFISFEENDQIVGTLAGLEVPSQNSLLKKSGFFKTALFYSGPRTLEEVDRKGVYEELERLLRRRGIVKYQIMDLDNHYDVPDIGHEYSTWSQVEYYIDLTKDWDELFSNIRRTNRQQYRKSIRSGLKFEESSDPEMVDILVGLQKETAIRREEKGYNKFNFSPIPHLAPENMKTILRKGNGRMFISKMDGQTQSVEFFITTRTRAYALFKGTTHEGYKNYANKLVFTEVLKKFKEEGILEINLGGVPKEGGEGIISFKKGFGSVSRKVNGMRSSVIQKGLGGILLKKYRNNHTL